ncbi:MAG: hypothetical protein KIS94_06235 [Chitinophagales bacterium]|nr:hypothetical protein [Chitinophagales bacterium]
MHNNTKPSLLFAFFAWALLILRFGYRYGTGDQVELLPYTLFLHNPALYPTDFFIQGLHASVPNERTVMAHLLLPFINHLEAFCFLFQMLATIVLLLGLEKIALRFIAARYAAWAAVLLALIPLNDFGLGNVELYSECLQAGLVAVAIVVWAVNFFLDRKFLPASALMAAATFIQVLDGLDIMLVLSALMVWKFLERKITLGTLVKFLGIYGCTAGVWLLLILKAKTLNVQLPEFPYQSPNEFFKILFEFRHPHHFIFASFSEWKVLTYVLLTVAAFFYFRKRSETMFRFVLISTTALAFYIVATDVLHWVFIANFQFYKATQWVKFFSVVAVVSILSSRVATVTNRRLPKFWEGAVLISGFALCWIIIFSFSKLLPYTVPYQIAKLKLQDDMLSICEEIKQSTPLNATFIQPFENTELKFYAERSSYVEFKANVRHKAFAGEWYRRIVEVYGVDYNSKQTGFPLQQGANNNFYNLSEEKLNQLKGEGVTHVLTRTEHVPALGKLVLHNNTYAVYKL